MRIRKYYRPKDDSYISAVKDDFSEGDFLVDDKNCVSFLDKREGNKARLYAPVRNGIAALYDLDFPDSAHIVRRANKAEKEALISCFEFYGYSLETLSNRKL